MNKTLALTFLLLILTATYTQALCPFSNLAQVQGQLSKPVGHPTPLQYKETTVQGCECNTPCTGLEDNGARCDRCYTKNRCGTPSAKGHFDYCRYPSNSRFERQTATQKQNELWGKITANQNSGPPQDPNQLVHISVHTTFDAPWDEMPKGRVKVIHSVGVVCKMFFLASRNSPYTGLFTKNTRSIGLIRMGSAGPIMPGVGVIPGIGVKFLRSRVKSANFVALRHLDALPNNSYNFFEADLTNKIPASENMIVPKFQQVSGCPFQVGLSDVCQYTQGGSRVARPVFPYELIFRSPTVQFPTKPVNSAAFYAQFGKIPIGTKLYDVYAFASPQDKSRNTSTLLGSIVASSKCVTSKYGDEKLFFQHQRIEEDWKLRPEWLSHVNPVKDCGVNRVTATPPAFCPSNKGIFNLVSK